MKYFHTLTEAISEASLMTDGWIVMADGSPVDVGEAMQRAKEFDAERQNLYESDPEEREKLDEVVYAVTQEGAVGLFYKYEYALQWSLIPVNAQVEVPADLDVNNLDEIDISSELPDIAAPEEAGAPRQRFCMNCGKPLADGQAFCMYCGSKASV